jgi:hypothetical protein
VPRLSKAGVDGKKRRPFRVLEIEEDVLNPKSREGKGESVRILESHKTSDSAGFGVLNIWR